jgi:hypothetical protein
MTVLKMGYTITKSLKVTPRLVDDPFEDFLRFFLEDVDDNDDNDDRDDSLELPKDFTLGLVPKMDANTSALGSTFLVATGMTGLMSGVIGTICSAKKSKTAGAGGHSIDEGRQM